MKKVVCILLFAGLMLPSTAQSPDASIDRRIYLWDVTLSMQGYEGKTPDVWDEVAEFLKKDIENITDESTDIIVVPFQDKILDNWKYKATAEGKSNLIRKIDEAKTEYQCTTSTNIAGSFRTVKEKYIDQKSNNLVILLTDGQNSNDYGGKAGWLSLLSSWQTCARDNNAYLIYFMVTQYAEDKEVENLVDKKDYSEIVLPSDKIPLFIDLYPSKTVKYNIKDDSEKGVCIYFDNSKKGIKLADGIKVSVKSSPDARISVDLSAEIENGKADFRLPYTAAELKALMNDEEQLHIPLTIELLNKDEIQNRYQQKIFLKRKTVDLVLINKIEKVLNIKIKR